MANNNEENISRRLYREYFVSANDEDRLPLTDEERELGTFFYPIVEDTFQTHLRNIGWNRPNEFYQTPEFQERVTYSVECLRLIILELSTLETELHQFMDTFSSFEENRIHSVASVRELAALTSRGPPNLAVPQATGSAIGIIGGTVPLIASMFVPAIICLGGITAGLGSTLSIGTTATDLITRHRIEMREKISESRRVLQTDRQVSQRTKEWLRHALMFVEATEAVLSINMMERLARTFRELGRDAPDLNARLQNSIQEFIEELLVNMEIDPLTVPLLPITITTLAVLFVSGPRRYFVFDSIVLTSHRFQGFTNGMEMNDGMRRNIAQIYIGGAQREERRLPTDVRALLDGVFEGIDKAFAATNILDINIGSNTSRDRTPDCIRAARALEEELDWFRRIYDGISILS